MFFTVPITAAFCHVYVLFTTYLLMISYSDIFCGTRRKMHSTSGGEEVDGEDENDSNNDRPNESNNEENKSRKRGRGKGWIEPRNNEIAELPDPDSLPALLYQLTSVMRKCGGVSTRLRALVLNAVSEVCKVVRKVVDDK
jgi:hypothetical protein